MSALRELIAFFGVEVDDKKLDHAHEKMESLASLAESVGAAIGVAFGLKEIGEFVKGQVEVGAELLHTSEMLGLTVGDLQAFQYAASNAGLGTDEANTALRFLNKNLGEAASKGGDSAAAFQKLGVHIKDANGQIRPTQDIFSDVADGISKLPNPAEKTAKAMEIFGRAGARMIPLLNKGSKGIDEFYGEFEKLGGGISEEFVGQAEEGEHQMNKLNLVWKSSKSIIAGALLPAFTWLVSSLTDVASWLRQLSTHSNFLQVALWSLAAVVGALAIIWAVLNIEIFLVIAVFALIVIAIDDIYTAFTGGKSVIGDFIDSIFGVGATEQVVSQLKDNFNNLMVALGEVWNATMKLVDAFSSTDEAGNKTTITLTGVVGVIARVGHVFVVATQAITDFVNAITSAIEKYQVLTRLKGLGDGLNGGLKGAGDDKRSAVTGLAALGDGLHAGFQGALGGDAATHAAPQSDVESSGDRRPHTTHNTIQVDVKTNGSPEATGHAVAKGVQKAISDSDLQAGYAGVSGAGGS